MVQQDDVDSSETTDSGIPPRVTTPRDSLRKGSELRDGRYVIDEVLGTGGFATVWKALDKTEGIDVAIKRPLADGRIKKEWLLEEADKLLKIGKHKNIVQLYDHFEEGEELFLVMEFVDGSSLEQLMHGYVGSGDWFGREDGLDYLQQIVEALYYAHGKGIVHRDIKPSNILVSNVGTVKIVDFGIARSMAVDVGSDDVASGLTQAGTCDFMSPEQVAGQTVDVRTDVFAAGLVGYMLLTGRHPFNHPSAVRTIFDLIGDTDYEFIPLQPDDVGAEGVRHELAKMLRKDLEGRSENLGRMFLELMKEREDPCSNCGGLNTLAAMFCNHCGLSLKPSLRPTPAEEDQGTGANGGAAEATAAELVDYGFEKTKENDWMGAIEKYKEARTLDPEYGRAYANEAYAQNRIGDYEEAISVSSKGIDVAQDEGDQGLLHRLFDARGFAKSRLQQYAEAISDFTEAIEIKDRNPRVWYHRAEAKAQLGLIQDALMDVRRASSLDPSYPPAVRLRQRLIDQKP